jgi:predicted Fe-S protein YdhL (DUF1289 family)
MDGQSKLCVGCWRTIDEIVAWSSASDEAKQKVWAAITARKNEALVLNPRSSTNAIDKKI